MSVRDGRRHLIALGALAILAFPVASAQAATRYVDFDTGDDEAGTNSCLVQATPCKSIGNALAASAADPDTILVDDDTYPESNLTVGDGKTLRASSFEGSDAGASVIDPGSSAFPAVATALGAAVTVEGFTIRNDSGRLVVVNGPATVTGNTFDEIEVGGPTPHLLITAVAGDPTITGNVFDKASQAGTAIRTLSADSPLISGNTIESYNGSIDVRAGTPTIAGNTISEQTGAGTCDPCAGIYVQDAEPVLTANALSDPVTDIGTGIALIELAGGAATGATLSRNTVRGGLTSVGISQFGGAFAPITLSSDLLIDYSGAGLDAEADVTATNVTVASTAPTVTSDIALTNNADLVLDSSIVFNKGISATLPFCTIAFSRGPTTSGGACDSFQTAADPLFRDADAGDYRLAGNSPLVDAGNPAPPPAGALDAAGNQRALARPIFACPPIPQGPAIRDMGAYEFLIDFPVPVPPCVPLLPGGDPPLTQAKRCVKKKAKKKRNAKGKRRCGKKKAKKKR